MPKPDRAPEQPDPEQQPSKPAGRLSNAFGVWTDAATPPRRPWWRGGQDPATTTDKTRP